MKTILVCPLLLLSLTSLLNAATVGHWRFDDAGAAAGGAVAAAENVVSPGTLDADSTNGAPVYSDDVPAAEIYDPVTDQTYTNAFSLDTTAGSSTLSTPNDTSLDTSFTVEFFVKYIGQPGSYESVLRRAEFVDLSWQVDFDHAANAGFGRIRTRWDTPAGAPDNVADAATDENHNFVLGPANNASGPKVYVDTGAKDIDGNPVGSQNTGNPADYIFDAASANPNETDVALQGDGINDDTEWHHVAMTFDQVTGEIKFYFDYLLSQTRTLEDTEADGYTHPAAGLTFGKLTTTENGVLMDELRYSNQILTPGSFLREPATGGSNTVAHWRMEEDGVQAGDEIAAAENTVSALHTASPINGTPIYSDDVPGTMIFDPITSTNYANALSLDASGGNARIGAPSDPAFDTSFTFELFIKLIGEPGGYHPFARRREQNDLRWQIDFDHAAASAFGRIRCRFDTPTGPPDNVAEAGVDENVNFVLGPVGGANVADNLRLFVDTDLGDGLVASYDDPTDWALDGDGTNDSNVWHHIAITVDQETNVVGFYFDYELMQSNTMNDTDADGYPHPAGLVQFGKFNSAEYGLLMDEVRYTSEVLLPFQFLQVSSEPVPEIEILSFDYDEGAGSVAIAWSTKIDREYKLERSPDLKSWFELVENDTATEEMMSFTDDMLPAGVTRMYYRATELPEE